MRPVVPVVATSPGSRTLRTRGEVPELIGDAPITVRSEPLTECNLPGGKAWQTWYDHLDDHRQALVRAALDFGLRPRPAAFYPGELICLSQVQILSDQALCPSTRTFETDICRVTNALMGPRMRARRATQCAGRHVASGSDSATASSSHEALPLIALCARRLSVGAQERPASRTAFRFSAAGRRPLARPGCRPMTSHYLDHHRLAARGSGRPEPCCCRPIRCHRRSAARTGVHARHAHYAWAPGQRRVSQPWAGRHFLAAKTPCADTVFNTTVVRFL
jgi:hypothetical protein